MVADFMNFMVHYRKVVFKEMETEKKWQMER